MPVNARTRVVFPWSIWPAVPTTMFFIPLLVSLLGAQAAEETHTFKSGVSNVRIDVQALDGGQPLAGLTQADFAVFDEGRRQPLVYFAHGAEPLSLVLLIDVSGSTREYIEQMAQTARQALGFLQPRDRVSVIVFARDQRVHLDWTDSHAEVASAIRSARYDETLGAGTNINEALLAAAKHIEQTAGPVGRRAVLILSDNMGLNYRSPDERVVEAMHEADTVVNGLIVGKGQRQEREVKSGIYRNPDFTDPDIYYIAERTGGEAMKVEKAGRAFQTMIERIRMRYSLHYAVPAGATTGSFRKIEVQLTPEARLRYPKAELRHRPGYRVRE
jgi:VWFA-related protein